MHHRPYAPQDRGFTLVELLAAISVMAMLSVMAWQALASMSRTETLTRQRTEDVLALQAGLGQWGADLDAVVETGEVPAIDFNGRVLRLTRRDALEDPVHSPGLQVVAWGIREGQWARWQQSGLRNQNQLAQAWDAAALWGERPSAADQARQVTIATASDWQVFYYRNDAWSHPLSSVGTPAAPPGGSAQPTPATVPPPPDGVRVVLTLSPGGTLSGELVRDWARPVLGGGKS